LALDTRMWDDQVPALIDIATVIRYDVRGFGRSSRDEVTEYTHADDLWRLLDHLGHERAVLVGLSMGGRIVLEAALAAPQRVISLVLLDAVLDGIPWDPDSEQGMAAIEVAFEEGGLAAAKAAWLAHGFFGPAREKPEVAARLDRMTADYFGLTWTGHDPHGPHPDTLALLETLPMSTAVIVGELDVPCFQEMAQVLTARIPRAYRCVVPDAGHLVNMEAPDVVNEILREIVLATLPVEEPAGGAKNQRPHRRR
jgi:pimeloyl-ACP methyl ester carboxylesterase